MIAVQGQRRRSRECRMFPVVSCPRKRVFIDNGELDFRARGNDDFFEVCLGGGA